MEKQRPVNGARLTAEGGGREQVANLRKEDEEGAWTHTARILGHKDGMWDVTCALLRPLPGGRCVPRL